MKSVLDFALNLDENKDTSYRGKDIEIIKNTVGMTFLYHYDHMHEGLKIIVSDDLYGTKNNKINTIRTVLGGFATCVSILKPDSSTIYFEEKDLTLDLNYSTEELFQYKMLLSTTECLILDTIKNTSTDKRYKIFIQNNYSTVSTEEFLKFKELYGKY